MQLIQWNEKNLITIYAPTEPEKDPTGMALTEDLNYSYENLVIYMFEDDVEIDMRDDLTVISVNGVETRIISDVKNDTAFITKNVKAPESEWFGEKFFYTKKDGFTLNEYWVDPRSIQNN